jgi:hypothetical protein
MDSNIYGTLLVAGERVMFEWGCVIRDPNKALDKTEQYGQNASTHPQV